MISSHRRLLATGDVVIGDTGNKEKAVEKIRNLFRSFDIDYALGNLEIPLTETGTPAKKRITWRTSPSVAQQLKEMGFTAMSLANNHGVDFGRQGLRNTLHALENNGISSTGAGKDIYEALDPVLLDFDRKTKIAVFSISCTTPPGGEATESSPGMAAIHIHTSYNLEVTDLIEEPGCMPYVNTTADEDDLKRISREIKKLKSRGFLVLISIHWGNSFQSGLAEYQRPLARILVEAGGDLIVGHHPHCIHPVEMINDSPVFYSLGNFLMDSEITEESEEVIPDDLIADWEMRPEALMLIIEPGEGQLNIVTVVPVLLENDGIPKLAQGPRANTILSGVEYLSETVLPWKLENGKAIFSLT